MDLSSVWFRGHNNKDYKLLPTILRQKEDFPEISLFYEYKAFTASINNCHKSNWDLLLDMQHYGLPTRLLDWSSSLGTALYFAVQGNVTSPCIWVLDPYSLSKESTGSERIFDNSIVPDSGGHKGFMVASLIENDSGFEVPYSIRPPHSNRRIAAQRGMFTVHTSLRDPIEELCPEFVKRIDLPIELINEVKGYLEMLGIDEFSLFPDQEGLSRWLKYTYGIS